MRISTNKAKLLVVLTLLLSLVMAVSLPVMAAENRDFDKDYDRVLSNAEDGTGASFLQIIWNAGEASSQDESIYKFSDSRVEGSDTFQTLVIRMKRLDSSTSIANIRLGFRKNDTVAVKYVALSELVNGDGGALPELTNEYQDYVIGLTLLDIKYVDDSTVSPATICGFHLESAETHAGALAIGAISIDSTLYNDFSTMTKPTDKYGPTCHWNGSIGVIIQKHYALNNSSVKLESAEGNLDEKYNRIVVKMTATSDVSIAPIAEDGTVGTAKTWASLQDGSGEALPALTNSPQSVVISLESLGMVKIKGIQVAATGEAKVFGAFFTSLEKTMGGLPFLGDVTAYETFSFEMPNIASDYDQAVLNCAELDATYILSYVNNGVKIANGQLELAQTGGAYSVVKMYKEIDSNLGQYRYMVLKVKADGGANLDGFRMAIAKGADDKWSDTVYANQFLSAKGLASTMLNDNKYPYVSPDGYTYVIVDMLETYGTTSMTGFDMYYTGVGKLLVDEILFANEYRDWDYGDELLSEPLQFVANAEEGYQYGGYVNLGSSHNHDLLELTIKGEGSLDNVRFGLEYAGQAIGQEFWFAQNEAGTLLDVNGQRFTAQPTAEGTKYLIDTVKSGMKVFDSFHIHTNGASTGNMTITAKYVEKQEIAYSDSMVESFDKTPTTAGYEYYNGYDLDNSGGNDYLVLTLSGTGALDSVRIQFGEAGTRWFVPNEEGTLYSRTGALLPTKLVAEEREFVIDLAKSKINANFSNIHIHTGGSSVGGNIKISAIKYGRNVLAEYSDEKLSAPVVNELPMSASAEYKHLGYVGLTSTKGYRYLILEMSGSVDLAVMRAEFVGAGEVNYGVRWFVPNDEGMLAFVNAAAPLSTKVQRYIIDLDALEFDGDIVGFHLHGNANANKDTGITIHSVKLAADAGDYSTSLAGIPSKDDTKPTLTVTLSSKNAVVGDKISLTIVKADNLSDPTALVTVMLGEEPIDVTNNEFVVDKEGVYSVKVVVTDGAGNSVEFVDTVTVAPAPTSLLWLWILLGAVALVACAVVLVIVIKKKKA